MILSNLYSAVHNFISGSPSIVLIPVAVMRELVLPIVILIVSCL